MRETSEEIKSKGKEKNEHTRELKKKFVERERESKGERK